MVLLLILRLEKQAEEYALRIGEEKLERGYQLLFKYVKMLITYSMFKGLAASYKMKR